MISFVIERRFLGINNNFNKKLNKFLEFVKSNWKKFLFNIL